MKTFLFDLDGTLLPLDMDEFMNSYFNEIGRLMTELNINVQQAIQGFMKGTEAMMNNDGSRTNEKAFWDTFNDIVDHDLPTTWARFEKFYENEFEMFKVHTGVYNELNDVLTALKNKGHRLLIATNPMFPKQASEMRVQWAELDLNLFEEVTTFEDYNYTKPNPLYYQQIIDRFDIDPKNCLMAGNNVQEDLIAGELGIETYLVTDHLINRNNADIIADHIGTMADFIEYLKTYL